MSAKRPHRRSIYLGWKTHGRIVARFLLLWAIYHLTFWQVLCVREYMQHFHSTASPEDQASLASFFETFVRQNAWMVTYALAFTSLFIWHVVSLTHRIIGPLKRVEEALYDLMDGKPVRRIEFRDGDLVVDFETAFNAYLSSLQHSKGDTLAAPPEPRKGVAEGPKPEVRGHCEPAVPLGDRHIADLLNEFGNAAGSTDLIAARNSAD
ncbi:MAG TPA: hypothetical protein VEI07_26660 [Planctomycetaceae bacterium]|nr:hypothetical protein [Planctomycetaceae bacterium]